MTTKNLLAVRASAGSGKTYELTTRYIALLRAGAAPESILAATFTRKAAGEILDRVLRRLAAAANDERERAALARDLGDETLDRGACRDLLVALLRRLDRVAVGTLDGWFARLARGFRWELGLPAAATMIDERGPENEELRREAIGLLLAEARDARAIDDLLELLKDLRRGKSKRRIVEELSDLFLAVYGAYLAAPKEAWSALDDSGETLDDETLDDAASSLEASAPTQDAKLAKALEKVTAAVRDGDWGSALKETLVRGALESGTYNKKGIPSEVLDVLRPVADHAVIAMRRELRRQAEALRELLERFDRHYTALRLARRALLFDDVPRALAAAAAAQGNDAAEYRLGAPVRHLLLDEFQDTNPRQWAILRPAVRRAASDPRGSVFVVGDVKQAIYAWRGATAEIFDGLAGEIPGLAEERRNTCRRCAKDVLDVVNEVFRSIVGTEPNPALLDAKKQPRYDVVGPWRRWFQPHETAGEEKRGRVEMFLSPAPPKGGDAEYADDEEEQAPPRTHARFAAERVKELADAAPQATIGVLVRSNKAGAAIQFALNELGVEASGEGGTPLDDDPAVEAILSAFELADHPEATAAAYAALHSPLAETLGIASLDAAELRRAARRIRADLADDGAAALVARWAKILAPHGDARGAERLEQLIAFADEQDAAGFARPGDFVRAARAAMVEEPKPARVRVLSIHKSKGLEFDVVVLPELGKGLVHGHFTLLFDQESPAAPIKGVFRSPGKEIAALLSPTLAEAYARAATREAVEGLCLLYVAMTRARYALTLVGEAPKANEKTLPFSMAGILRGALARGAAGGSTEPVYAHGDPRWMDKAAWNDAPDAAASAPLDPPRLGKSPREAPRRGLRRASPSSLERGGLVTAEDLLRLAPHGGRRFGSLIHALFARVAWSDDPAPSDAELAAALEAEAPDVADREAAEAIAAFRAMLGKDEVRAALARPRLGPGEEAEALAEQPFAALLDDGTLLQGRFDRVVLRRRAGRVVGAELLDYKTDAVDGEKLDEAVETYRPQIDAYRKALCAMHGLPPEAVAATLLFVGRGVARRL